MYCSVLIGQWYVQDITRHMVNRYTVVYCVYRWHACATIYVENIISVCIVTQILCFVHDSGAGMAYEHTVQVLNSVPYRMGLE